MDKLKILIADPSEDFHEALADTLRGAYHVRTACDGASTLQALRSFQPDMLVLDLMLPGLDGITLLQRAMENGQHPIVLAISRCFSDYILDSISRLGVGYVMTKPCDISAVVARISDMSQRIQPPMFTHPEPKTLVSNILLRLGIATKLRGYSYLREAILLMKKNPGQSITKELYPSVAAACGATPVQIERSIRSAITTAWLQRDDNVWQLYFPPGDGGTIPKPTNAAFISRIADLLSLSTEDPGQE